MNIRIRYIFKCILFLLAETRIFIRKGGEVKEKSLLIIHTDAIGDYILLRNFISQVKESERFKEYKITLCGNIAYKDLAIFFDGNLIDSFVWVNKGNFLNSITYRRTFLKKIKEHRYDVAINPSYSRDFVFGDSIIRCCNAKVKIGQKANDTNVYKPLIFFSDRWYTSLVETQTSVCFEFERNKQFFEVILGEKLTIDLPTLPVTPVLQRNGKVLIFPGAGEAQKMWQTDSFAVCADYIKKRYGRDAIVIGSEQDYGLGEKITQKAQLSNIVNYCGKTSLVDLVNLIAGSPLLLTNDSSSVHIAGCTGTPIICVGSGRHYGRFTPNNYLNSYYIFPREVSFLAAKDPMRLMEQTLHQSISSINEVMIEDVIEAIDFVLDHETPADR